MQELFNWVDNLHSYKVMALSNLFLVGLLALSWLENQRLRKKIEMILTLRYMEDEKKKGKGEG